jgi:hypothetical protein
MKKKAKIKKLTQKYNYKEISSCCLLVDNPLNQNNILPKSHTF